MWHAGPIQTSPVFFQAVLGPHLKLSSGYFASGGEGGAGGDGADLAQAEERMLAVTCQRARVADGQRILELGCGWGSLSLWIASHHPGTQVVAVVASPRQRDLVESRAGARRLANLEVVCADPDDFVPQGRFDRIIAVESLAARRAWDGLLRRAPAWLRPDGFVFLDACTPSLTPTSRFEAEATRRAFADGSLRWVDWLKRRDLPFSVEDREVVDGTHAARTAGAWLRNLDARAEMIEDSLARDVGREAARVQIAGWRLLFVTRAELFGWNQGRERLMVHLLLRAR